jgi:surfeit locus 1 family protein
MKTRGFKPLRPAHAILLSVCIVVGVVCYGLGIWQLNRLGQRRARNDLTQERLASAPAPLDVVLGAPDDAAFRPVRGRGRFDAGAALYLTSRSNNDVPGHHVVAPFRPEAGTQAVLVNLGWIDYEQGGAYPASSWIPNGVREVVGILKPSQTEPIFPWLADPTPSPGEPARQRWRVLSIDGIQAQVPYPIAPYYLALTEPLEGSTLVPAPELDISDGPHLSYAIQWFAFGTTAIAGGFFWVRSMRRR